MTPLLSIKILGLIVGALASVVAIRKDSNAIGAKRLATLLAVLGFGVAVVAELVDASQKQQAAIETTNKNNALLAEVQRTLHPLFPLSVDVRFRASLSGDATRAFRTALEQKYQREHPQNPDIPIVWLDPEESDFPTCKKDPVALQIVSAKLGSMVRLYSRQRTKDGRFEQADVEFCPCPELRDIPSGKTLIVMTNEARRRMVTNRDYLFSPDQGLYMRDGGRKIDFVDSKNT